MQGLVFGENRVFFVHFVSWFTLCYCAWKDLLCVHNILFVCETQSRQIIVLKMFNSISFLACLVSETQGKKNNQSDPRWRCHQHVLFMLSKHYSVKVHFTFWRTPDNHLRGRASICQESVHTLGRGNTFSQMSCDVINIELTWRLSTLMAHHHHQLRFYLSPSLDNIKRGQHELNGTDNYDLPNLNIFPAGLSPSSHFVKLYVARATACLVPSYNLKFLYILLWPCDVTVFHQN